MKVESALILDNQNEPATPGAGVALYADFTNRLQGKNATGTPVAQLHNPGGMASPHVGVGQYLSPPTTALGTNKFTAADSGKCWFAPVDIHYPNETFSQCGVYTSAVASGGTHNMTFGIYPDNGAGSAPNLGGLYVNWGATTIGGSGYNAMTGLGWTNPYAGRFWIGMLYTVTGTVTTYPTIYIANGAPMISWSAIPSSAANMFVTLLLSGQSTMPTSGALTAASIMPCPFFLRSV